MRASGKSNTRQQYAATERTQIVVLEDIFQGRNWNEQYRGIPAKFSRPIRDRSGPIDDKTVVISADFISGFGVSLTNVVVLWQ